MSLTKFLHLKTFKATRGYSFDKLMQRVLERDYRTIENYFLREEDFHKEFDQALGFSNEYGRHYLKAKKKKSSQKN